MQRVFKKKDSKTIHYQTIMTFIPQLQYNRIEKFSFSRIETYQTYSKLQLQSLLQVIIERDDLCYLIGTQLKVCYLLEPILLALEKYTLRVNKFYRLVNVLQVLVNDEYYRYLSNCTQWKYLVNNRTTCINVQLIIASLILYTSNRLTFNDISNAILIFSLEEGLYNEMRIGIPLEIQKISSVLRKIDRNIKIDKLKHWIDHIKGHNSKHLSIVEFIYLVGTAEKNKPNTGLFLCRKKSQFYQSHNREQLINKMIQEYQQQNNQRNKQPNNNVEGIHYYQKQNNQNQQIYQQIKKNLFMKNRSVSAKSNILIQQINKVRSKTPINKYTLFPSYTKDNKFWNSQIVRTISSKYQKSKPSLKGIFPSRKIKLLKKTNKIEKLYENQLKLALENKRIKMEQEITYQPS